MSEKIQIERIIARDHATEADAIKILQSQVSRQKRLDAADDIISNDGTLNDLRKRVVELHDFYLKLARQKKGKDGNVVWLAP